MMDVMLIMTDLLIDDQIKILMTEEKLVITRLFKFSNSNCREGRTMEKTALKYKNYKYIRYIL